MNNTIEIGLKLLILYGIFCGTVGALFNEALSVLEDIYYEKKYKKRKQKDKECTA